MLSKLGVKPVSVKKPSDVNDIDGLIIPGGESTTIGKLMKMYGLDKAITRRVFAKRNPLCVWGTCAGAILIAKKVYNQAPDHLKLMDIIIERNAYGRQMESFETQIEIPTIGTHPMPAVFIRAPKVHKSSKAVRVLAAYEGSPVMLEENNLLVTMFHPELTNDTRIHKYFIDLTSRYVTKI